MMTKHYKHKEVAIEKLIPYALNSRVHSDAQVAQLAASIRAFGFTNPVLIDEKFNLIAGHGRVLAARKLELESVPAIVVTDLDERKRRALIIADNKLALNATWDDEILKVELEDLADEFADLMGYTADEINVIFNGWQTDIETVEKAGENLDGIARNIKIMVDADQEAMAKEVITNALDAAGVTYDLK
jgi:ParB-like chromosome segregation protein Spo0J